MGVKSLSPKPCNAGRVKDVRVVIGNLKLPADRPEDYRPEWGRPPARMPTVEAAFQVCFFWAAL